MYLKALVQASAKRERVEVRPGKAGAGEELLIFVKEPAERNLANTRVRELVAEHLKVPLAKVRIMSGHHSPSKMLSIHE